MAGTERKSANKGDRNFIGSGTGGGAAAESASGEQPRQSYRDVATSGRSKPKSPKGKGPEAGFIASEEQAAAASDDGKGAAAGGADGGGAAAGTAPPEARATRTR